MKISIVNFTGLVIIALLLTGFTSRGATDLIKPKAWIKNKGIGSEGILSTAKNDKGEKTIQITSNKKVTHIYSRTISPLTSNSILEVNLNSKGKGTGLVGFYFYDYAKRFISNSVKTFSSKQKWGKYKFNFKVKDFTFSKKVAFCRMVLGTYPNSDIKFEKVTFSSKIDKEKYVCIKAEATPPRIDGVVLGWDNNVPDKCWQDSLKGIDFKIMGTENASVNQTQFSFCYDKQNLYFMAICYDKNIGKIKATAKEKYDKVWQDECVEVFLNPHLPDKSIMHLFFNPLGSVDFIMEGGIKNQISDVNSTCKAKIYPDRWELEVKLPWKFLNLKPPVKGECWSMNVARTHRHKGERRAQYSTWAYLPGNAFLKPEYFVPLKFGDTRISKSNKEMSAPTLKTKKRSIVSIQKTRGRDDLNPVGAPIDAPRISWANPFDGKALRCLFFLECAEREAWELRCRLEMRKADVVFSPVPFRSTKNTALFAFNPEEILKNLEGHGNKYDVIVVGTNISNSNLIKLIINNVKKGSGLVYLTAENSTKNIADAFKKILPKLEPLDKTTKNYITKNIAIEGIPYNSNYKATNKNLKQAHSKAINSIGLGQVGKGKVVNIGYAARTDGLIPYYNARSRGLSEGKEFFSNQIVHQWWENVYSLLMRSICWVGEYKPKCEIDSIFVNKNKNILEVNFKRTTTSRLLLECVWDSKKVVSRQETNGEIIEIPDKVNSINIKIPSEIQKCDGIHLCHLILKDGKNKKTIDWATAVVANKSTVKIKNLTFDKKRYDTAESVRLECDIVNGESKSEYILRTLLKDSFNRIIQEVIQNVNIKNKESIQIFVPLKRALTVQVSLQVELRDKNNNLLDCLTHKVCIPENNITDDYIISAPIFDGWGFRNYLYPAYETLLKQAGINQHGYFPYSKVSTGYPGRFNPRTGMVGFYESRHYSGEKKQGDKFKRHTRKFCYALRGKAFENNLNRFCKSINAGWGEGIDYFAMCDEGGLAGHGGNIPEADYCYCKYCRKGFKKYVKILYGNIEKANGEWGTDFKNWDSIEPMVLEDAWKQKNKNYSLWCDYKLYMEDNYLSAFEKVKSKVFSVFPGIKLSLPNAALNFGSREPLSGENYYKWARVENFSVKYFGIMSTLGYNSFASSKVPKFSWWGYSEPISRIKYAPWWYAFNDINLMWWGPFAFCTGVGHTRIGPFNLFSWNITQTERSLALKETTKDLIEGVGKIIKGANPSVRKVAMLYSQPSFYAACAEKQAGRYLSSELQWRNLIRSAGYELNFVAEEEIAKKLHNYKVLVLPYSIAISKSNQDVIKQYIQTGGIVFSDCIPGRFNSHGKYFNGKSPLEQILRNNSKKGKSDTIRKIKYGNGKIVLLNRNPIWIKDWKLFRKVLVQGGIKSEINSILDLSTKKPLGLFETYTFTKGKCRFYGIISNGYGHGANIPQQQKSVQICWNNKAHIYDVREQKYLGFKKKITTDISLGKAKFYAAMPYQINKIDVSCKFNPINWELNYNVRLGNVDAEDHVYRVEVYNPEQQLMELYTKNYWSKKGKLIGKIPFAFNDKTGKWTVKIIDVVSGINQKKEFLVPDKHTEK